MTLRIIIILFLGISTLSGDDNFNYKSILKEYKRFKKDGNMTSLEGEKLDIFTCHLTDKKKRNGQNRNVYILQIQVAQKKQVKWFSVVGATGSIFAADFYKPYLDFFEEGAWVLKSQRPGIKRMVSPSGRLRAQIKKDSLIVTLNP